MKVTAGLLGVWRTVTLEGKFIVRNVTIVRRYFEEAENQPVPGVLVDMSGVTELDSSAITLLVNFQRRVVQKDGMVVLAGLQPHIAEIFSIVGIDKLFRICSDREDFRTKYLNESGLNA